MVSSHRQYRLQGWMVSATVHGLALIVALGLMAQVKPVMPKEVFTWDVALVEPKRTHKTSQAEIEPTQEPVKPTPTQAVPPPNQPKKLTQNIPPREVTPVLKTVETSRPIEQTVAVQTKTEEVTPVIEQQSIDEPVVPVVQQEVATQPEITETPIQPVEARVVETAPVTHDPDPPASPAPAQSVAQESAPQTPTATHSTPSVKVDHGWLAESLRRRLAEIKRYPSSARLNGWEGKVVLRAVIRSDGHLSEVKVYRSSGHETLDNAAIEAIRLACPLHMHQPLGTSEVAVYVPMVYSLGS